MCWAIHESDRAYRFSWEKGTPDPERRQYILQHPEMLEWADKIGDVLAHPEWVFVPDLTLDQS